MLNAFKREVPHFLSKLLRDGGKIGILKKVNDELKLSRLENKMLKLKVHQAEEIKRFIKKEALFYKWCLSYV